MKILFVCHRLPYPPNRGGKIRPFNMIRHLSRNHSVVVASLAHSPKELKEGERLKDHCDEVIAEVLPSSVRWLQALAALPTREPSSVAYFRSARLHERVRVSLARNNFDVIFVHCAFVAQYVMDADTGFRIMDFGDLDSAKWAEYARWRAFPFSRMYALESKKLRTYEQNVARRFHRCTLTTHGESDEFQTFRVSTPCSVIPNGVDTSYFSSDETARTHGSSIVFLGRMDYFPNIDGVCHFAENILPLIRKKVPDAELRIVGANPARKIRELGKLSGITVTGSVPDVRSYVRDAAVAIAPLRIARGTQNKILESMSMGIPVVASPEAARGIQAIPGIHLLVGESPEMFSKHVVDLLTNESLGRRLSAAARLQVEKAHLWPASMKILDSLLGESAIPRLGKAGNGSSQHLRKL